MVLGGENLPLLAAPQEDTPTLQPARSSRAGASHQHPTPAPLHSGMQPWHRANLGNSSADAKICRTGWRGLLGWNGISSSASSSSQTCLEHHLSFVLV